MLSQSPLLFSLKKADLKRWKLHRAIGVLTGCLVSGVTMALPSYQIEKVDLDGAMPVGMNDQGQILFVQPSQMPGANKQAQLYDLNLHKFVQGFDVSAFPDDVLHITDVSGDYATGYVDPDLSDNKKDLVKCSLSTGQCNSLSAELSDHTVNVMANDSGMSGAFFRSNTSGSLGESILFDASNNALMNWGVTGSPLLVLQAISASGVTPLSIALSIGSSITTPLAAWVNSASGQLTSSPIDALTGNFSATVNGAGRVVLVEDQSPWDVKLCDFDRISKSCIGGVKSTGINFGNGFVLEPVRGGSYYPETAPAPTLSDAGLWAANRQNAVGHAEGFLLDTQNLQQTTLTNTALLPNPQLDGQALGEASVRAYFRKNVGLNVADQYRALFPNDVDALPAGLNREQLINELLASAIRAETEGRMPSQIAGLFNTNTYYFLMRQITPQSRLLAEVRTPKLFGSSGAQKLMLSSQVLQTLVYSPVNSCNTDNFSLTASQPAVRANTPVAFDATLYACDASAYQYRFLVDGQVKQNWSTSRHFALNSGFNSSGAHEVKAELKSGNGAVIAQTAYNMSITDTPCVFDGFGLSASQSDLEIGGHVQLATSASYHGACQGAVEYTLYVDGQRKNTWQGGSSIDWSSQGLKAGQHQLIVDAVLFGKQIRQSVSVQLRPTISASTGQFWFIHWATIHWNGIADNNVKLYKNGSMKFTKNDRSEFYIYIGGASFKVCDEQANNCSRTVRAH